MKPRHQFAAIQLHRAQHLSAVRGNGKLRRVAPDIRNRESDLLVATAAQDVRAERRAQRVDGFAKRGASVRLIELGPEKADDPIASLRTLLGRQREKRQQRAELRLGQQTIRHVPVDSAKLDTAKEKELDSLLGALHDAASARYAGRRS